jgi:hypothetical protein
MIPPALTPTASAYASANPIPQVLPGAGCVTVNGNGVGPATQPSFAPAAGGQVVAPTAQEADIRPNGGAGSGSPSTTAAYVAPSQNQWTLVAVGGLLVPFLVLVWGARPSRRRARRR